MVFKGRSESRSKMTYINSVKAEFQVTNVHCFCKYILVIITSTLASKIHTGAGNRREELCL
jgi:hypothetical protein